MKVAKLVGLTGVISVFEKPCFYQDDGYVLDADLKVLEYETKASLRMRRSSRPFNYQGTEVYFNPQVGLTSTVDEVYSSQLIDLSKNQEIPISNEAKLALLWWQASSETSQKFVFFQSRFKGRKGAFISADIDSLDFNIIDSKLKGFKRLINTVLFLDTTEKKVSLTDDCLNSLWQVDIQLEGDLDYSLPFTVLEIEGLLVFPIKVKVDDVEVSKLVVLNKQDGSVVRIAPLEGDVCGIYEIGERILVVSNEGAYYIESDLKPADVETRQLITLSNNGYNLRRKTSQLYPFNEYAILVFPMCSKVLVIDSDGAILCELDAPDGWYPERVTWVKEAPERPFVVFSKFGGPEIHRQAMAEFSIEDAVAGIGFELEKEPECEVTLLGDGEPCPVLLNLKVDTIDDAIRFGEMYAQNKAYELGTTMYNRTDPNPMFNGLVCLQIQSDTIVAEDIEPLLLIMEERFDIWAKKADVHSGDARLLFCGLETAFVSSKVY